MTMVYTDVFDTLDEIREEIQALRGHGEDAAAVQAWVASHVTAMGDPAWLMVLEWLSESEDPEAWLDRFVAEMG